MNFIIAIKSSTLETDTGYNFLKAVLQKKDYIININMVFFFQDGVQVLLEHEINKFWGDLLINNNLYGHICPSSCKKRGININNIPHPFKASSIVEFINYCDAADKIVHL